MADNSKKSYYEDVIKDSGLSPITSEELQSKFDAITKAEYDKQRTDLQTATNKYYNQLYDTQKTTMDTIRQANAQAVASGASKGVQAANELSALLGLQSEAVTGATDLANQATTLAQDETKAMLENMLTAETQAAEQNQALAQILTQAGSVDVEQQNADTAKQQVLQQYWDKYRQAIADGDNAAALRILQQIQQETVYVAPETNSGDTTQPQQSQPSVPSTQTYSDLNYTALTDSLNKIPDLAAEGVANGWDAFWSGGGEYVGSEEAANNIRKTAYQLKELCETYGLNYTNYEPYINNMLEGLRKSNYAGEGGTWSQRQRQDIIRKNQQELMDKIRSDYKAKAKAKK